MKNTLLALTFLLLSCTQHALREPPQYSMMPPYMDVEKALPTWSADLVISPDTKDFQSVPIDSGRLITIYRDTMDIPPGILISEKKALLYTFYKSNYEQQQTKIRILDTLNRTYYQKALDAEQIYQKQIHLLQQDVKRTWFEKNSIYIGYGFGVVTTIMLQWAVLQAAR